MVFMNFGIVVKFVVLLCSNNLFFENEISLNWPLGRLSTVVAMSICSVLCVVCCPRIMQLFFKVFFRWTVSLPPYPLPLHPHIPQKMYI